MNGKQFIEEANKFRSILGLPLLKVKRPVILKYDDKISNNKDNIEYVVDALSKNQTTLFLGPTGSGKTNLISKVATRLYEKSKADKEDIANTEIIEDEELPFLYHTGKKIVTQGELQEFNEDGSVNKDFIKNKKEIINCLSILTPSRVQNQQNEQIYYNLACIIAESKKLMEYDLLKEETAFSVVYDKVTEIIKAYELEDSDNVEVHISLIIDEAQELTLALGYREQAIKNMIEVSELVKSKGGSVLLMTATPEPIIQLEVDDVVECVKKSGYKAPAESGYIYINKTDTSMSEFVYRELEKMLNKGERPLINYNSIRIIKKLKEKFFFEGFNFLDFDGSQKKFTKGLDNEGKTFNDYKNPICNDVINNSSLPDTTKNGTRVDGWFVTSVMNVGTNVNHIGGRMDEKVNPTFTVFDQKQSDANQIVQFLNRVRYQVNKNIVLMNYYDKSKIDKVIKPNWLEKEEIIKREYEILKKSLKSFELHIEAIKLVSADKNEIIFIMEQIFKTKNTKGFTNNLDCIYIDHDTLEIKYDINAFWKHCYSKFQMQYYYYPQKLVKRLYDELGVHFIICNINSVAEVDLVLKTEEQAKEVLKRAIDNNDLLNQIEKNNGEDVELNLIKETDIYAELKKLMRLGIETNEAVKIITNGNKGLKKAMRGIITTSINELTSKDMNLLEAAINDKSILMEITDEKLANNILRIISDKSYVQLIKKAMENNIKTETILKHITYGESDNKINEFIIEEQNKTNNKYYVDGKKAYLSGITGITQRIILDRLYILNESGNMTKTKIDDKILTSINKQIKNELNYYSYSNDDILKIIQYCFTMDGEYTKRIKK
jgi:energy-coupling factor transporter ATP-binding protein EcfA2